VEADALCHTPCVIRKNCSFPYGDGNCPTLGCCGGEGERQCCVGCFDSDAPSACAPGLTYGIGFCERPRTIGEACGPAFLCKDRLQCIPFLQKCAPDAGEKIIDRDACLAFYSEEVHQGAISANETLNFGITVGAAAVAGASYELGNVYGQNGKYGCYLTYCVGLETDAAIGEALCAGITLTYDQFAGDSYVTVGSAGEIVEFTTSQQFEDADCFFSNPSPPCLNGTADCLGIGVGILPASAGAYLCTTIVRTVVGNSPPTASCYQVTACTDSDSCEADVDINNSSSDPDGDALTISQSPAGPYAVGARSVTLTVTDGNDESATCSGDVVVNDCTAPIIAGCPASLTVYTGPGRTTCDQVAGWTAPTSTDNCAVTSFVSDHQPGDVFGVGFTPVAYTALDAANNADSCVFGVEVIDNTPPVIDPAASALTVECDGSGNASQLIGWLANKGGADAADACTPVVWSPEYSALSHDCGATGSTNATFTFQDSFGNRSATSAPFTIEDTTDPTITCPETRYQQSPVGSCTDSVSYEVTAGDVCGSTSINCVPDNAGATSVTPAGGRFPVGTTTVTCTATDDCGLTSACSFDVVVNDPPRIVSVVPVTQMVQYSDKIVPVVVTATDCGPGSSLSLEFDAADVPDGLALSSIADTCKLNVSNLVECTWTLGNNDRVRESEGDYVIDNLKAVDPTPLNGATLKSATGAPVTVQVKPEDATVAFDGGNPLAVQVARDGGNTAAFSLSVHIQELFPDLAASGLPAPGDISLAVVSMELIPVGPGVVVNATCTPDATDVTGTLYADVLHVTCVFDDVAVNVYTVSVTVDTDGYYIGSGEDILVVFDPSLGFTTGGMWFYWPGTTDRTNVGFIMQYSGKRTRARGNLAMIRHLSDGSQYRITSSSISGLAVGDSQNDQGSFGWASFSGKSNYNGPESNATIGNYEFVAYAEDYGDRSRNADGFWVQVFDRDGAVVLDLSMNEPATTNVLTIEGGNIVVPHKTRR